METSDLVILAVAAGLILNFFVVDKVEHVVALVQEDTLRFVSQTQDFFIHLFFSLNNWKVYLILGIIALPFFGYYNYRFFGFLITKARQIRNHREFVKLEIQQIKQGLAKNISGLSYDEMKTFMGFIETKIYRSEHHSYLKEFRKPLKETLAKAKRFFEELLHKRNLQGLKLEQEELEDMNKELEETIQKKHRLLEEETNDLLRDLNIHGNPVFKKSVLTDRERSLLLKNDYEQINQYCVCEQKMITVLVRKISNHSLTHIFLVWSVMRLLEKYKKIRYVDEHLSIDADITFEYEDEKYALEIETGTLLGKKQQTDEKIKYLNRKYPNRWMIIVSNKNLLWKYRKLGFATTRNEIVKNLQKLLKMS